MARGPVSSADEVWFQRGLSGRFACSATLFACGAGDGNRTRTVSLGRVLIPPCFPVLQRFWRPHLASVDPYRPGLVARAWPGALPSPGKNRALAEVAWAEDHRDLTECPTSEDVRRAFSPFDARVPVNTACGAYVGTFRAGFADDHLPSGRTPGVWQLGRRTVGKNCRI
jgi:hypothetical protein